MKVVVVESPAKAKTINRYLGDDYTVLASYGHVRDLPSKDGSVQPDQDFEMSWQLSDSGGKRIKEITDALKGADRLILATDPDREGEAISWHVCELLKAKKDARDIPYERVVFNEITKSAILTAMDNPRDLDIDLVDAYLARRALDHLIGFLSHLYCGGNCPDQSLQDGFSLLHCDLSVNVKAKLNGSLQMNIGVLTPYSKMKKTKLFLAGSHMRTVLNLISSLSRQKRSKAVGLTD
jgi:hypothetical protein